MRCLVLVAMCLMAGRVLAASPGLVGDWQGEWIKNGDPLPVMLSFNKAAQRFTGALNSDALQVAEIPIIHVTDTQGRVHFEVQGDDGSTVFDGTVKGDHLEGAFVDHEHHDAIGRFNLLRSMGQTPTVQTRGVVFTDGSVSLGGTLLLPSTPGLHPAVLFLQGSGPEGRWANRYLAQKFAQAGIAALIFDKRGVAGSTGDWRTSGFDVLAEDGAAGIRWLRTQPEVDPARVGVYGHSQGGTIAPLVATRAGGVGFIIASAAGGLDPAAVETYSVENAIGLKALPPTEQVDAEAYVKAVVKVAYGGAPRARLEEMAATFKDRPWFFAPPPPADSYWTISRKIAGFHPSDSWRQVAAPVLLVYGALDERVPPEASIRAIEAALRSGGHASPTVQIYPKADHTFTLADPKRVGGWPKRVPGYAEALIRWIKEQPERG